MQRYHGDFGVHYETPACQDIGCVLDDGSHSKQPGYDDLYDRYRGVCQELADCREALADERRRRLAFEALFSDIEQMLAIQRRKP